ncbi:MAG: glycosyltransferase [Aeoliella sp.]
MNILMFTNTYLPHIGGVAESVRRFANSYMESGHQVLIVAPWFDGAHADEPGLLRLPAWEHVLDTDFSLPLPIPAGMHSRVSSFSPDIIHSHHPFLLGDTALRVAATENVPIVFTNHTQYDVYSHYVRNNSNYVRRFATKIAIGYANLCDAVIAPSESVRDQLQFEGVTTRLEVIPTGVEVRRFSAGKGRRIRIEHGLPEDAFVVGHIGRLAVEKNLRFLATAASEFVSETPHTWMYVAGEGPLKAAFREEFESRKVARRLVMDGRLNGDQLCDAYAAMDVFAFASQSETQGMVLAEAMAAGTPVVAVDAPGVREIVRDQFNGRLLDKEEHQQFVKVLQWMYRLSSAQKRKLSTGAQETAKAYSMSRSASKALSLYGELVEQTENREAPDDLWHEFVRRVAQECRLWANVVEAGTTAAFGEGD